MTKAAVGQRYRHYKGKEYIVLALARHTETLETLVVYQAQYDTEDYGSKPVWCRPLEMFEGKVKIDKSDQARFVKI